MKTDTNGNFISATSVGANETDWQDTAGHVVLKIITGASSIQCQVPDTPGTYRTWTLNLSTLSIKTNFSCAGVIEYTGTASLPTSLTLPNGQQYQFTYEPTPNQAGYYTGRVQRVTLPTGGYYEYDYLGSNDSVYCSDGTTTNLSRLMNDGTTSATWTFVRAQNGTQWTTTVTAPQLTYDAAANQTVYTFNGSQEVSRQTYQGSAGGTLLRQINTTWLGSAPSSVTTILDGNVQSKVETDYDSYLNLTAAREYAWNTGAPGSLQRTTSLIYLTDSAYTSRNILNRVTRKTISDSSGTTKYRQDISYDAPAQSNSPCITGAAQHDDTNYGCSFTTRGNPTSATTYANAAAPSAGIIKNVYYDSLGNLRQADVDCCQLEQWSYSSTTQYAYPDSVTRGASGGTQLTRSYAYENTYTGFLLSTTDENNKTTSYAYDLMRRITTVTRPDGAQISYSYDDTNKTVTITQPVQGTNVVKQMSYFDGLARSFRSTTLDVSNTVYSKVDVTYDPLGRTWKVSNPYTGASASYWTETRFDGLGRVTKTILPDTQQTTYAYADKTVTVTDPTGKQGKSEADALGRLVTVYEPDVNNGNQLTQPTTYGYTVLDALASVNQGVQTRTFSYDDLGRLTSQATPEAGTFSYQYNNNFGLVSQRTDARGVITTYSYDTLNRLTSISYNVGSTGVPATASVNFTYGSDATQNNKGRLITMTDGVGSEGYTYDQLGRTTQVQKVISGTTYTTGYAYNLAGEVTSITYPSGRPVQPSYDGIGRLSTVASGGTNFTSGYTYNPAFQATGLNYGNGVAASFGYSTDRLQLTSLSYVKGASTLFSLSYGYTQGGGNNGQITSVTDSVDNGRSVTYTYDALYRLKTALTTGSASYPQWGLSWTYDRYGNRLNQTQTFGNPPTNSLSFANPGGAQTNRPDNYAHDANGNMTSDGLNSLTYDAENRMVTSSGSAYTYDGKSLRVKKVSGGTTTVYIFSGTKVIAEYVNGSAPGSPTREYIYSGSALLAKVEGSFTHYFQQDHLSNRLITDSTGAVVEQKGHYPFGEAWYEGATPNKLKITSYERDAESGNDYAIMRSFVSRFGRFLSPDPVSGAVADPQSLNRYSYALNDPCNRVDPLGLDTCTLNVYLNNQVNLSQKELDEITRRMNDILSKAGDSVRINTNSTGMIPDVTLQLANAGWFVNLFPGIYGVQSWLLGTKVYVNNLKALSPSQGLLTSAIGSVGLHEIDHNFLGGDQPYDEKNPNMMMFDTAPESARITALTSDPNSALWKLTPQQMATLYSQCIKKHPPAPAGGGDAWEGADRFRGLRDFDPFSRLCGAGFFAYGRFWGPETVCSGDYISPSGFPDFGFFPL